MIIPAKMTMEIIWLNQSITHEVRSHAREPIPNVMLLRERMVPYSLGLA